MTYFRKNVDKLSIHGLSCASGSTRCSRRACPLWVRKALRTPLRNRSRLLCTFSCGRSRVPCHLQNSFYSPIFAKADPRWGKEKQFLSTTRIDASPKLDLPKGRRKKLNEKQLSPIDYCNNRAKQEYIPLHLLRFAHKSLLAYKTQNLLIKSEVC